MTRDEKRRAAELAACVGDIIKRPQVARADVDRCRYKKMEIRSRAMHPCAIRYNKDKISGGGVESGIEDYVVKIEKMEQQEQYYKVLWAYYESFLVWILNSCGLTEQECMAFVSWYLIRVGDEYLKRIPYKMVPMRIMYMMTRDEKIPVMMIPKFYFEKDVYRGDQPCMLDWRMHMQPVQVDANDDVKFIPIFETPGGAYKALKRAMAKISDFVVENDLEYKVW